MPEDYYDILYLEINNVVVDKVRFFGNAHMRGQIEKLKTVWLLNEITDKKSNDNYLFYIVRQSRLNNYKNMEK